MQTKVNVNILSPGFYDEERGIVWFMSTKLEHLDFADDVVLISSRHNYKPRKDKQTQPFCKANWITTQ